MSNQNYNPDPRYVPVTGLTSLVDTRGISLFTSSFTRNVAIFVAIAIIIAIIWALVIWAPKNNT